MRMQFGQSGYDFKQSALKVPENTAMQGNSMKYKWHPCTQKKKCRSGLQAPCHTASYLRPQLLLKDYNTAATLIIQLFAHHNSSNKTAASPKQQMSAAEV